MRKPHSAETRAKMSAAAKGKTKSLAHRAKLSAALKGRLLPEDAPQRKTGRKQSEATIQKLHERRHTEETKLQISKSLKSAYRVTPRSKESKEKISNALIGHTVSEETRIKLSEKMRLLAPFNFRGGKAAEDFATVLCPAGFIRGHYVLWGKGNERFELDFSHLEGKINIELDGASHNDTKELDVLRDKILKSMGWRVIRIKV